MRNQDNRSRTALFAEALAHHQAGRLGDAGLLYGQILRVDPEHAAALHYSGLIAHHEGHYQRAITLMTRSIAIDPRNSAYLVNLGTVFAICGDLERAGTLYREAIDLSPEFEIAHQELGNVLRNQGKFQEAAGSYARAINVNPNAYKTINTLGSVLTELGRPAQAAVLFKKAISLNANYAEAHNNLGCVLKKLGRPNEAIESFQRAIVCQPTLAEVHSNVGDALSDCHRFQEAVECCQRSIDLSPDRAEAYLNLGNAYKGMGQLAAAEASYERALKIAPDNSGVYNNLGEVRKVQGRLAEAHASFKRAVECASRFEAAYSNLLYFYSFTRHVSPMTERNMAEGWERSMLTENELAEARQRSSPGSATFARTPLSGRKLRVGILTAEIGDHAVAKFLQSFLEQLDRDRFSLTLFSTDFHDDVTSRRLCKLIEEKKDALISLLGVPNIPAAERIRAEQIDVLIETTGHTCGSRLGILAHRAAPVQCSYIGYWSTTGLTEMDWFITGTGVPSECDAHFTEGLWRLPRLAHSYSGDSTIPDDGWTPDPDGTLWLGSFNNNAKIREETLGLWAEVLKALPEAKLLFEDRGIHDEETHCRIVSALVGLGIQEGRIEFIPYVPGHTRHMKNYDRLDIALDTIPFNSGTTAFDALWMGVPLITIAGTWLGATLAGSVVAALGHPEWIAQDVDAYVTTVCSLARDVEGRKTLRKNQRARMQMSQLCDAEGLARSLEDAFEAMYELWMSGDSRPGLAHQAERTLSIDQQR